MLYRFDQTLSLPHSHYEQTFSKKILLIENNPGDVFLINMLLAQAEDPVFDLTQVDSLGAALLRLDIDSFDIILVDLELSDSQGIDTLLHLQEKASDIPTVVLTDLEDDALAAQLVRQGAQDYLVKSKISQSWLRSTITLAIARAQSIAVQHRQEQQLERSNQFLQGQVRACKDELAQLRERLQMLSALASTDGLTGIANRYCFEEYFEREWLQAYRDQKPLSLIMIDLDYFKQFNDSCGHMKGDICLRQIAQSLDKSLKRPRDLLARYGGEEFVAILPDTPVQGAIKVATNLGLAIRALGIRHPSSSIGSWVTASFGVASMIPKSNITSSNLLNEADRALYLAKENGRDRIAHFQHPTLVTQQIH